MEDDFSGFKNGEVAQQVERRCEVPSVSGSIPDLSTRFEGWSEEIIHLADQVAKGYGIVATDEEIEAWAENLSSICAKIND